MTTTPQASKHVGDRKPVDLAKIDAACRTYNAAVARLKEAKAAAKQANQEQNYAENGVHTSYDALLKLVNEDC